MSNYVAQWYWDTDWKGRRFKAFYHGPMFRYERPQKGRLRQFHQVGIELLGVKKEQADIVLKYNFKGPRVAVRSFPRDVEF